MEVRMFSRVQVALGIAFAAILMVSITASAKGGFDLITITGPDLKGALHVTDPRLTEDFFTFANFYEDKTAAPADPGQSYEITRHYVQGVSDVVFDRLHYYPETGFVFYDGIENGDSEYDGEWYTAHPDIKVMFELALTVQSAAAAPAEMKQLAGSASEPQPAEPIAQPVESSLPSTLVLMIAITIGLGALCAFALWWRKPSVQ
jgi:hypothetical protein